MALTTHGHHIPGTVVAEDEFLSRERARCGGPGICTVCSMETAKQFHNIVEKSVTDGVLSILVSCGLEREKALDVIVKIHDAGILFRKMDL